MKNRKTKNKLFRLLTAAIFLFTQLNPAWAALTTHSVDADFAGSKLRVSNTDTPPAVKLESYYQESAADPYTVGLWHFDGNTNDSSGKSHTGTLVDTATVSGTTQFMGNVLTLDGAGDYMSVPDSEDWNFGSGDFTISLWVNFSTVGINKAFVYQETNNVSYFMFHRGGGPGDLVFTFSSGGTTLVNVNSPWLPTANTWYHTAITRNGNVFTLYLNGVPTTNVIDSDAMPNYTGSLYVGTDTYGSDFPGYIDSLRILKGRALSPEEIKAAASRKPYAVYTSPAIDAGASTTWDTMGWTESGVRTGDGETLADSTGLVAQWNFNETSGTTADNAQGTAALDGTLTNFASTASQDAAPGSGWTNNNKRWGAGALMFDGVNDYVSVPDNAVFNFGAGDFTMEAWVNVSDLSANRGIFSHDQDINTQGYYLRILTTGAVQSGISGMTSSAGEIKTGNWYHLVLTRNVSNWNIYKNGISIASATNSSSLTDYTGVFTIGVEYPVGLQNPFKGIIDSARVYSRALSPAEILSNYNAANIQLQTRTGATSDPNDGTWEAWKPTTGETQLLSMDSDSANWKTTSDKFTKLLIHSDESSGSTSLTDSSPQNHTITASGNASTTSAQSKFGNSLAIDGIGDWLSLPNSVDWNLGGVGGADYTIDFWVYWTSIGDMYFLHIGGGSGWIFTHDGNVFGLYGGGSWGNLISYAPTINTWTHIAIVRNRGTVTLYVGGTSLGTLTDKDMNNNGVGLSVGSSSSGSVFNGYMDEIRISKGIARWTSNFTPPAFAHQNQEGAITRNSETTLKMEGAGSTELTLGQPQADANTVALWHMEETSGSGAYIKDATANANHATPRGTTVVDGIFGKARSFNGIVDELTIPDSANWDFGSGDFSIDMWFKRNNTGTQDLITIPSNLTQFGIRFDADNTLRAQFYPGPNYATNKAITDTNWHHIAYIRSGNTISLYLDGVVGTNGNVTGLTMDNVASNLSIGYGDDGYFNGLIDELRITKGRALSADEIAETYRMGANHRISRAITANDLSTSNLLPFYIAADRPGTYLEAVIGESQAANYEADANTVLFLHGDEIPGSTAIKDASVSGKAITVSGNAKISGAEKIGNSVYFDGSGDWLSIPHSSDWNFAAVGFSLDFWAYINNFASVHWIGHYGDGTGSDDGWYFSVDATNLKFYTNDNTLILNAAHGMSANKWNHIAITHNGNGGNLVLYINGQSIAAVSLTSTQDSSRPLIVGTWAHVPGGADLTSLNGYLDEIRILKGQVMTPDQIRSIYEYGLRSHPITIDFTAKLDAANLVSGSGDKSFTVDATAYGLAEKAVNLYPGDKIILRENVDGTEYIAQGTVTAVTSSTGAVTVASWDSGATFPASGFSANASVFKWQREYFDLSGSLASQRDAVTNLTIRPTNGAEGRTIYLDDFRKSGDYLTAPASSTIASSANRYLQYRAIVTTSDPAVSPSLTGVTVNNAPLPASYFAVTHNDYAALAGDVETITITAKDINGNVVTGYAPATTVSITKTESGAQANSAALSKTSLTSADFVNGVATITLSDTEAENAEVIATDDSTTTVTGTSLPVAFSPAAASKIVFTSNAQTLTAGTASAAYAVAVRDQYDNLRSADAIVLDLSSSSIGGKFDVASGGAFNGTVTSITTSGGTGTFYYKDTTSGSPTLTVSKTGLASATQDQTVNFGTVSPTVTPASYKAGEIANNTIAWTSSALPQNGKVELDCPVGYDLSGTLAIVSGNTNATVLVSGNTLIITLGTAIAANSSVSLEVSGIKNPLFIGSTGTYALRTKNASGTQIDQGTASANTIIAPTLTLLTPSAANISLTGGNSYDITWNYNGEISNSLKLSYSTDGTNYSNTIATGESNDGAYTWTVPFYPGAQTKVKIEDTFYQKLLETTQAQFGAGTFANAETKGTGSGAEVALEKQNRWDIQLQYIDRPALGDLDNDGDLDLVAGGGWATVQVYKNTGDSSIPVWTSYSGWNIPSAPTYDCRPVLVDLDNDGDLDLLWSSLAYGPNYVTYENTGTPTSPVWVVHSGWNPSFNGYASLAFADLDNDGLVDLMIGANDGIVYAYKNTGAANNPIWTAQASWNSPDVGSGANPALADLDSDGDFDLLIGAADKFIYGYKNTGTASSPIWTAEQSWNTNRVGAKLTVGDLDNDGDMDIMTADNNSAICFIRNIGSATQPSFSMWKNQASWNSPDVGANANPIFADLDNDGKNDLLISSSDGTIYGYKNTGSVYNPVWTAQTSWNISIGAGAIITAGDLDGDGDVDLMIGKGNGIINSYENTGTVSAPVWTVKSSWDIQASNIGSPALGDLDNDGDLDLVVGRGWEIVEVYKNTGDSSIPVWTSYSGWNIPSAPTYDCRPVLADLDNDGDLDLLYSSRGYGPNYVTYENIGTPTSPVWAVHSGWNPSFNGYASPAFVDLDNDGFLELIIGSNDGIGYVYTGKTIFYPASGSFTSAALDTGGNLEYGKLNWGASVPSQIQPENGLVGLWHMDEASGATTVADSVGTSTGTINGATTGVAGKSGNALSFDGVDDSVGLGNWFNLQTFTISIWVKAGASQVTYADIIDNGHSGTTNWVIQYQNSGTRYQWGAYNIGGINFDLTPDTWQHLVITLDTNRVASLYLDGKMIGSVTGTGPVNYNGYQFLRLASLADGGRNWNGQIDEFAVYNRALTVSEIQQLSVPRFQLSASADGNTWGDFVGPDGTSATYFTTSGTDIPSTSFDTKRYIKYKAYLSTSDVSYTPSLNDVSVTFTDDQPLDSVISDVSDNPFTITVGGALSNTSVVPASTYAGAVGNVTVSFTTAHAVPADGKVVITFPAGFTLNFGAATTATSSTMDGTLAVSTSGQVLTLTRSGGSQQTAGAETITLTNIKNPSPGGSSGTFAIQTTTSSGPATGLIDQDLAVTAKHIIGTLTSPAISHTSLKAGAALDTTISFTTISAVPAGGKVEVDFPVGYDLSGTLAYVSGNDGTTLSVSGNTLTLTLGLQIAASTAASIVVSGIKSPQLLGSTGAYALRTKDSSGALIDEGTAVANTLVAPVLSLLTPSDTAIKLYAGQPYEVTWSYDGGTSNNIKLTYSTNGGSSYLKTIAQSEANDNTYTWTVPYDTGTNMKVKVEETFYQKLLDTSDAQFGAGTLLNVQVSETGFPAKVILKKQDWDVLLSPPPLDGYSNRPTLVDLDGDGDLDLVVGAGNMLVYVYENTGTTAIPVWTTKTSWDFPKNWYAYKYAFTDLDGDGDLDLMAGYVNGISYAYENTGSVNSPVWTAKPSWNAPAAGTSYVSPAFADLDNDGDPDLLIGSYEISYAYENTGSVNSPVWTAKPSWNAPNVGDYSTPAFADLDNDGDFDLMVSGSGSRKGFSYENTGTVSNPIWTARSDWDTLTLDVFFPLTITFGDLDKDGDFDLMAGNSSGRVSFIQNRGSKTNPSFKASWMAETAWNAPDVGDYSAPAFADLDNDGDFDLMAGANDGVIHAFENTGSSTSPVFSAKTAWDLSGGSYQPALGDLNGDGKVDLMVAKNDGIYGYKNTGTLNSPVWTAEASWNRQSYDGRWSIPALVDLDGDGDLDLVVGADNMEVYVYENTGTTAIPVWTTKTGWDFPKNWSAYKYAFTDLDGDGDLDLMAGYANGISYAYENTGSVNSPVWTAKPAWNAPAAGTSYVSPAFADLDNDGNPDLLIGSYDGISYAYKNNKFVFYPSSGAFTSRTLDSGGNLEYGALSWGADVPSQSGANVLKFQLAAKTADSGWVDADFVGPDGTSVTYFTTSGTDIPTSLDTKRYLKYKAYLSTADQFYTPALNDVSISFSDSNAADRTISDFSDNTFEITRPEITITAPGNAESDPNFRWIAGRSYEIKWKTRGKTSQSWTIEGQWLDDLGGLHTTAILDTQTTIASSSFDGTYYHYTYTWTIPNTHTLTNSAYVRITAYGTDVNNAAVTDSADSTPYFKIVATPQIALVEPISGQEWFINSVNTIKWTMTEPAGDTNNKTATLQYAADSPNFANWVTITAAGVNNENSQNSFSWTIDKAADLPAGAVKLKVFDNAMASTTDTTTWTFKISNPAITVAAPLSGGVWRIGATPEIQWSTTAGVSSEVKIEYFDGTNWNTVIESEGTANDGIVANDGGFVWTVPNIAPLTTAKIRITDAQAESATYYQATIESLNFEIAKPLFTISLPAQSPLRRGGSYIFSWTDDGTMGTNLDVLYAPTGTSFSSIKTQGSFSQDKKSFTWSVPVNTAVPQTNAKFQVKDNSSPFGEGTSAVFSVDKQRLTFDDSTVSGVSWPVGSQHTIGWTTEGEVTGLYIYYYKGTTNIATIDQTANNNALPSGYTTYTSYPKTYSWTIANDDNYLASGTAKIRISVKTPLDAAVTSTSTAFSVREPYLTVSLPAIVQNSGKWVQGDSIAFNWSADGYLTNNGQLELAYAVLATQGDDLDTATWVPFATVNIAGAAVNSGSFDFRPLDYSIPAGYLALQVRDINVNRPLSKGRSAVFEVSTEPYIGILAPLNVPSWRADTDQIIQWQGAGSVSAALKIEYSTDNNAWYLCKDSADVTAENLASIGSFSWRVPAAIKDSTAYIRVVDTQRQVTQMNPTDISAQVKGISLTDYPGKTAGESFTVRGTKTITWSPAVASSAQALVKIEYSTDAAHNTWSPIIESEGTANDGIVSDDGSFDWTVPDALSGTAKIRVGSVSGGVSAASDNDFKIVGSLEVSAPAASASWIIGTTQTVSWNALQGTFANVKLQYSVDNGASWKSMAGVLNAATTTANNGSYSWTLPDDYSGTAKARVYEENGLSNTAESSLWTIASPQISISQPSSSNNGNSALTISEPYDLKWTTTGSTGTNNLKIEISYDNQANWSVLEADWPNTSPKSITPTSTSVQAWVKISEKSTTHPGAVATAGPFTVLPTPQITLSSPVLNSAWTMGKQYEIKWDTQGLVFNTLRISYTLDATAQTPVWTDIISGQSNTKSFYWTVSDLTSALSSQANAKIRITDDTKGTTGYSDLFTISIPSMSVVRPQGGEVWAVGDAAPVKWSYNGAVIGPLALQYDASGVLSDASPSITASAPKTGQTSGSYTYSWTVPSGVQTSNVKIRIKDSQRPNSSADSPASFEVIAAPTIEVTSPVDGDVFVIQDSMTVNWKVRGLSADSLSIEYWDDVDLDNLKDADETLYTLSSGVSRGSSDTSDEYSGKYTGAKTITLPDNAQVSANLKLRVRDPARGYEGLAAGHFRIRGGFELRDETNTANALASSTEWKANTAHTIKWYNKGSFANVKLEYATSSNGTSWGAYQEIISTLANSPAGDNISSYSWTVPDPHLASYPDEPPQFYYVKLKITNLADTSVFTESAAFKIGYYTVTWKVKDYDTLTLLDSLTVSSTYSGTTYWRVNNGALTSTSDARYSAKTYPRRYPYGVFSTFWSKDGYGERSDNDRTVNADMEVTVLLESAASAQTEYKVYAGFAYNEDTDKLKINSWLEKKGTLITSADADVGVGGDGYVKIYDGEALKATLSDTTVDSNGNYWFEASNVVKAISEGGLGLESGKTYFARMGIWYRSREYQSGAAFEVTISKSLKAVTESIKTMSEGIKSDVASVTSMVSTEAAATRSELKSSLDSGTAAVKEKLASEVSDLKTQTAKILTAAETTIPDKINTDLAAAIKSDVKPHIKSGILNRDNVVKIGQSLTIRYRTETGKAPAISIYNSKNALMVSGTAMTEVSGTGIYEYNATFTASWGTGDFSVVCSESSLGTVDAMVITVIKHTLDEVAGMTSSVMGSTSSLSDFKGMGASLVNIDAQFKALEQSLSGVGQNIISKVSETKGVVSEMESVYNQLANLSAQIKSIGATKNVNLEKLYEVSQEKKEDIVYLKNKAEELKAVMEINKKMTENVAKKPVVQSWFEYR